MLRLHVPVGDFIHFLKNRPKLIVFPLFGQLFRCLQLCLQIGFILHICCGQIQNGVGSYLFLNVSLIFLNQFLQLAVRLLGQLPCLLIIAAFQGLHAAFQIALVIGVSVGQMIIFLLFRSCLNPGGFLSKPGIRLLGRAFQFFHLLQDILPLRKIKYPRIFPAFSKIFFLVGKIGYPVGIHRPTQVIPLSGIQTGFCAQSYAGTDNQNCHHNHSDQQGAAGAI